jgi:CheY-like chemotaxis protein
MIKKVLLFDDDADMLEAIQLVLEYAGFSVATTTNHNELFELIEAYEPDIILVDYLLRGTNGGEICQRLKTSSQTAHIPIMMISAYPQVIRNASCYACDTFLAKPFDMYELIEKIKNTISFRSLLSLGL